MSLWVFDYGPACDETLFFPHFLIVSWKVRHQTIHSDKGMGTSYASGDPKTDRRTIYDRTAVGNECIYDVPLRV